MANSLKQFISSAISEVISSQVQTLLPELLRSLKDPITESEIQQDAVKEPFPALILDPLQLIPVNSIVLHVNSISENPNAVDHTVVIPPYPQIQQHQEKYSSWQILSPISQEQDRYTSVRRLYNQDYDDSFTMIAQRKG